MTSGDRLANEIQFQFMVDLLGEEIADLVFVAVILGQLFVRGERKGDLLILRLLLFIELADMFFCPFIRIASVLSPDIIFVAQFFNRHGMFDTFTVVVRLNDVEKSSVLCLRGSDTHSITSIYISILYHKTQKDATKTLKF